MENNTCLMDVKTRAGILRYLPNVPPILKMLKLSSMQAVDMSGSGGRQTKGSIQWLEVEFNTPVHVQRVTTAAKVTSRAAARVPY